MFAWVFDTLYFLCTDGYVFQDFDTRFFLDTTYQNCWVNYFFEACYLREVSQPMRSGFVVLVVVGC
jgi:hypothetical protein